MKICYMFIKAYNLNMRSFATWKVMRRDKSEIELTVSSYFLRHYKKKKRRFKSTRWWQWHRTLYSFQWSNDALTMQINRSHTNELMPIDIRVKRIEKSLEDEMIHHFQLIQFEMRRHLLIFFFYFDYSLGASHHFHIVKCVNVSMIYALLTIPNSCLCRQAYRALEHHHLTKRDFIFYSFCSHTNWCFVDKKKKKKDQQQQ